MFFTFFQNAGSKLCFRFFSRKKSVLKREEVFNRGFTYMEICIEGFKSKKKDLKNEVVFHQEFDSVHFSDNSTHTRPNKVLLLPTFWFSAMSLRMNSTSSIMRVFSLWLDCRCCSRTSSSFCDLWMASSCGIAKVVAKGIMPEDVRRGFGRFELFRLPLNDPRNPESTKKGN